MPDFTPEYDFPYPTGVESPNGPAGLKALAEAVEAELVAQSNPTYTGVAYNGAWTDFGGGTVEEVSYALVFGIVRLRGIAKHGTTSTTGTVFTLPDGFRPAKQRQYLVLAGNGQAVVNIHANGVVEIAAYRSGSATAISFDGINFDTAA